MKMYYYGSLLLFFVFVMCDAKDQQQLPSSAFLIDTVQAVIFGQDGTQVLTRSDVTRPSLSGVPQSLDDLIFERLVFGDAQKYKIIPDEEAVDKYLAMVQKENNLTLDQLKDVFASAGYTYEEGREQFKRLQTVNSMLDFKIRSQVIVPKKQVEEYYEQNPVVKEAEYHVQYGFLPYMNEKKEAQAKALRYMARTGKEVRGIQWSDPFWVKKSEIADDKEFLLSMNAGDISVSKNRGNGFEIYKMVDRHDEYTEPLNERYHEIADILRRPVFEDLMEKYKKNLFDSVSILHF